MSFLEGVLNHQLYLTEIKRAVLLSRKKPYQKRRTINQWQK